ncbi:MAG: 50S ribosomal protein L21 [Candidatus Kerfeldbacteria bacterium RIFCSPHIGHO2_02_FULL_42_14]|uniref:Large ribosomal subunit protein bL21 n=1 Tax=Candidatus Kerfeldbacteria bacterium RIFCSPHIGHO2_02_FULL_42_14 TaxID=1798540 RepID=A0A1G2ARS3_9BACT|nr:MAG: 50S ribosomal protein L21 [Candidatus Kerfeldbacteria bacterium RIFCSPHIGHO2_02_FULL_42_14]OGY80406.1 MAG: 50S ribosomal protein L21 [Candidatus Kerfeldbacteria bacterium RIFCSPHIGHO2_12_FULL_42_13]OGY83835.1 MAG: 50S ribosomal protein L21 [Candidatus Kerfeldbacteria bacterium RIFCSPLOWO2_02_FULL_42_19]OGY85320.1 MAG: 50S ribosomal protein L21 [Candidatus Kerfeldbacteria bacterium RIFCSPLOWO2_12_FULL_43_9]
MIAVIETGGKQYKVKEQDTLRIEKIQGEKGEQVTFQNVLLISDEQGKDIKLGTPFVVGAKVDGIIVQTARSKKIDVIKFKSKVRYRRKIGHRQYFTEVRIQKIHAA